MRSSWPAPDGNRLGPSLTLGMTVKRSTTVDAQRLTAFATAAPGKCSTRPSPTSAGRSAGSRRVSSRRVLPVKLRCGAIGCRRVPSREGGPPCESTAGARSSPVVRVADSTRGPGWSAEARPPWAGSTRRAATRSLPRRPASGLEWDREVGPRLQGTPIALDNVITVAPCASRRRRTAADGRGTSPPALAYSWLSSSTSQLPVIREDVADALPGACMHVLAKPATPRASTLDRGT